MIEQSMSRDSGRGLDPCSYEDTWTWPEAWVSSVGFDMPKPFE